MFEKSSFLLAAALMVTLPSIAEQLTPDQALQRAVISAPAASQGLHRAPARPSMNLVYTAREDAGTTFYVFNGHDGGYCIVAADDAVTTPILGYSDHGTFDPENIPANMKWFLSRYSLEIAGAIARQTVYSPAPGAAFAETQRRDIDPLCKTTWDQSWPYNDLCPLQNGQRTFTGCVATAMAQVMKVHNWPDKGQGTVTYRPSTINQQLTVDFSQSVYDWANMTDSYSSSSTAAQCEAVAKLMYDCGVASKMEYSTSASGATVMDASVSMVNNFRYSRGIQALMRDAYEYDEFVEIIYKELVAGRPVLCGGSNSQGGHSFVMDGYRQGGYFHLNWGWSGLSDGYYLVTALDPTAQGSGGSASGYDMALQVVTGIEPDRNNTSKPAPYFFSTGGFASGTSTYKRGSLVSFNYGTSGAYWNFTVGSAELTFRTGVRLVNTVTGDTTNVFPSSTVTMKNSAGSSRFSIPSTLFPEEGSYTVTPVINYDGNIYDVHIELFNNRSLHLDIADGMLNFSQPKDLPTVEVVSFNCPTTAYFDRVLNMSAELKAINGEYLAPVSVMLLNERGNSALGEIDVLQIDIPEGETQTIELQSFISKSSIPAGRYRIGLYRGSNYNASVMVPLGVVSDVITFSDVPPTSYNVRSVSFEGSTSYGASKSNPATVPVDNFVCTIQLRVTQGYFSDFIMGCFFNSTDGSFIGSLSSVYAEGNGGETVNVDIKGNLSGMLEPGETYIFSMLATYAGSYIGGNRYVKILPSGVVEISAPEAGVTVFPNPVEESTTVSAQTEIAGVEVYSIAGTKALEVKGGSNSVTLEMGASPSGVYIARIVMADGSVETRQIIKR